MESVENVTEILTSSENTNNKNREKELQNLKIDDDVQPNSDDIEDGVKEEDEENEDKDDLVMKEKNQENQNAIKSAELRGKFNENNKNDNKNLEISSSSSSMSNQQENVIDDKIINENDKNENKNKTNLNNEDEETNIIINEEYSKYVTYNELGEAIYTDPTTNYKYRWCQDKNNWIPISSASSSSNDDNMKNPYENEHYKWCSETNQWIPKIKTNVDSSDGTTTTTVASTTENTLETEFYKWDKDTNQWIPKTQSSNVTYRFDDGVHTYTDQDGTVFFWDTEKNAWFPKIDDEFMARYQLNYGFIDNTTTNSDETNEVQKSNTKQQTELIENNQGIIGNNSNNNQGIEDNVEIKNVEYKSVKRKATEPPKWFDIPPEQNTKVYVSNLPDDITEEEFIQVMSKCGLIMRDPQTQKYKIKLYTETNGQLKGDGLCDYIKVESVDLALNLLDGYDVRGHKIKIQRAKFQMRGEYNPALKPKKKKKDKEKLQKMKERLFDWRPEKMRGERSKHERNIIIKNLFEPELFDKEVQLIIEYQNDLREECNKCGTVRKVVIFDRHPDGVAQITMSSPEEADLVVEMMNRRFFGQRRLIAEIWDGKTKYKIVETEAEIEKRLSNWDKYLEENDGKNDKIIHEENKSKTNLEINEKN